MYVSLNKCILLWLKIVPKRHWEWHKCIAVLKCCAHECPWPTKAPRVTCAGTYDKSNAPLKGCIRLLQCTTLLHHDVQGCNNTVATLLQHDVQGCNNTVATLLQHDVKAPHCWANSKTGRTTLQNDLRKSDCSWNTFQDFLMIPSLSAAALETEWRWFSTVILASNVAPNVTKSVDSFSTVPYRVNGDELSVIWILS